MEHGRPSASTSRILVTGCAGFIGARVTAMLLDAGHEVVGIDNLNPAYDPRLKSWRLDRLRPRPRFEFHSIDITDKSHLSALFERRTDGGLASPPFDAIVNLAARAGVRQSVENPWVYFETNLTGTLNLLELMRHREIPKLVLASTSSLYGASRDQPFREESQTDSPLSPYAASKKAAETLCYTYHELYGVDVTVLRYFTVYGPAGRPDMSLFRFVQWICESRPLRLYGDGSQSRDFTYVDDIARGTCAALRPLGFEIINLGSDRPVVINEAIRLVERLAQTSARVVHEQAHAADVPATWAHIEKAERLLGWRPRVSFPEGVSQLFEWYRANRSWASVVSTA